MARIPKLLVAQRQSLSHDKLMSRSISARFGPLLDYMARRNMLTWNAIPENEISVKQLNQVDAVLLNKHTSPRALDLVRLANQLGKISIYDLDDWIMDLPQYSVTNLAEDMLENISCMLREAKYVSVSNQLLARKLRPLRQDIHLIVNGFDYDEIKTDPDDWREKAPPRILFSNTDGLKLVKFRRQFIETLRLFMRAHPEITLDFWGDSFPEMHIIEGINLMGFLPNQEYKRAIRDAGYAFAIVPLGGQEDQDTFIFNSCKSCIKYIDYGSLGIPGIYSQTPVYSDNIIDQSTGILAHNTSNHWYEAMANLYLNPQLRTKIRSNAYVDTRARFNLDQPAYVLASLLT